LRSVCQLTQDCTLADGISSAPVISANLAVFELEMQVVCTSYKVPHYRCGILYRPKLLQTMIKWQISSPFLFMDPIHPPDFQLELANKPDNKFHNSLFALANSLRWTDLSRPGAGKSLGSNQLARELVATAKWLAARQLRVLDSSGMLSALLTHFCSEMPESSSGPSGLLPKHTAACSVKLQLCS
jgi:hypothetical protein